MESRVNCVIILAMLSLFSNANVFTYGLFESFVNVALQKPARQSSTYIGKAEYNDRDGFNYSASLAVDGNNSTNFRNDSCSHTDANETFSWWKVDLQGSYMLSKIRIFQRNDAFTDRNAGSRIWGLSVDNSFIGLGGLNRSSPVVTIDIRSQHRFKQIQIDNAKTHGDAYLCLCEVQVFADFDECKDGDSFCNNKGKCYNTQGSFNCSCYRGFTGKQCETVIQCMDLVPPAHGNLRFENGIERRTKTFNSTVSMTCDNGYQSFGDTFLRCGVFGAWNGSLGRCTDVDECRHGDRICNNNGECYNTQGSFNCKCDGGFNGKECDIDVDECKGRPNVCSGRGRCNNTVGSFICQCHDGYTGEVCKTVIQCMDLVPPAHGNLRFENGIERRTKTFNSTVSMTCDNGYQSFGDTFLRCGVFGAWNGSLGRCTDVDECRHGDRICNNNGECYNTQGSFNCKCDGGFNGKECDIDVDECKGRPNVCSGRGRCNNTVGSFICQCHDGYTGEVCKTVIQCMDLVPPAHGNLRFENGIERRTKTFNSTVSMTCDNGYQSFGDTFLRCGVFGAWNGSLGRCTDVDECRHGDRICNNNGECYNTQGSFNCKCDGGFNGKECDIDVDECKGRPNVCSGRGRCNNTVGSFICQCHDGYTGEVCKTVIKCTKQIAEPEHSELTYSGGIEGSRTYNTVVTARCKEGYYLTKISQIRCNEHGEWEGSSGACSVIKCTKQLAKPGHSELTYSGGIEGSRTYNTVVTARCKEGYYLTKISQIRCNEHGEWEGSSGACSVIKCTKQIAEPEHSELTYSGGIEGSRTYNTVVTARCKEGYYLTKISQIRCNEHGEWEGSSGACSVINCTKQLAEPDNSELTYSGGIEGSRTFNTVVTARCKEGYYLTKISQISCNEHGEWEGSSGACSVIFCELLLRPNNSILSIDGGIEGNWTYNTTATVSCEMGYTLTGNKTVRCTHSSQWNGSIGYCVATESLDSDYHAAGSVGGVVVAVFLVVVGAAIGILVYRRIGRPLEQTAKTSSEEFPRSSGGISNIIKEQTTTHKVIYAKPIQMKEQVSKTSEVKGDNEYTNNGDSSREYYSYLPKKVTEKHAIQLEDLSSFFLGRKLDLKLYHEEYNELPQGLSMRHDTALLPQNQKKNRYKNIYPYDDTRVQLEIWDPATETDYINACYVNGFKSFHAYIAAQGPTLEILNDFWRMIWQTKSLKIVMLTNLIEDGKHKCEKYWPDESSIEFGAISVRLVQCESFSDFTVRTLELTKVQKEGDEKLEQRHVKQFHFTAWPDKRVPRYASSLVHFHRKVRKTKVPGSTDGPIVVHCRVAWLVVEHGIRVATVLQPRIEHKGFGNELTEQEDAGIGRTGTFLALDYLVEQAEELGYINVFKCLETFRKQRVGLVQTAEQYIFVHEALVEALTCTRSSLSTSEFLVSYNALLEADVTNIKRQIDFEFEKLTMYADDATEDVFENGKRTDNRHKNRYSNILPDKNYCPFLNVYVKGRGSYINAVFLPAYKMTDIFIITQIPLENTKVDFWRMVYQFDVRSIVMMNTLSQMKDEERYWPEDEKVLEIPPFRITLESKSADDINCNYIFSLRYSGHLRKVQLSRAIYWTDDEPVPKSPSPMLKQIDLIQNRQQETGNKPIIVHCMNGAERSGLFCVVAALIERVMTEQDVAVEQIIKQMRSRRPQVIPSVVQFKFCYDAIKTYLEQYDSYANCARP